MNRPSFAQTPVFAACVQGVVELGATARLNALVPQMHQQEQAYDQLASTGQLYRWQPHSQGHDDQIALGNVTRGEFKGLYTAQMARAGKPARNYYDQIRVSAPNNICPYCGIGAIETLDHFLPKSRYSSLSVLPLNLIPACRDCNTGKHGGDVTENNIPLHPYFEDTSISRDEWLFAKIYNAQVIHVEFHARTPVAWPESASKRVINHFSEFDLPRRFSIQAAGRLSYYAHQIAGLMSGGAGDEVANFLRLNMRSELAAYGVNSWQAALAKAVSEDVWFPAHGYVQLL